MKADTLRLIVPNIKALGHEGIRWAWSLVTAIVQGATLAFQLDENDIVGHVLTRKEGNNEVVAELLWVDTVVGGSGVLQDLAENFSQVARFALKHLAGHDCAGSCYRCLRTYFNQRVHHLLDWRLVVPWLENAQKATLQKVAAPVSVSLDGPEWEKARREGCQSPAELRLLQALRAANLPEPRKQFHIYDERNELVTVADFAYPEQRLLIYVDGLAFHSAVPQRLHDARITRWLTQHGYRVLRFYALEVFRAPQKCAEEIRRCLDEAPQGD